MANYPDNFSVVFGKPIREASGSMKKKTAKRKGNGVGPRYFVASVAGRAADGAVVIALFNARWQPALFRCSPSAAAALSANIAACLDSDNGTQG